MNKENKKAQAQIISVVLIILLVLAAIIIVWQVIRGTVGETSSELETRSDCISADIEIANVSTNNLQIRRNVGGPTGDISVKVIINGAPVANPVTGVAQLETVSSTITAAVGNKVEVAAIIGTTQCAVVDSATVP